MNDKQFIYVRPSIPRWAKITYGIILFPFVLLAIGMFATGVLLLLAILL